MGWGSAPENGRKSSGQAHSPAVDASPPHRRAFAPALVMRTLRAMPLLAAACGSVHYVDPNQPGLFRATVEYRTSAQSEPMVWMTLIDLFDESGTGCAAAQQWAAQAVRGAMRATASDAVELPGMLVSPNCDQPPGRAVDAVALQNQIALAASSRPAA